MSDNKSITATRGGGLRLPYPEKAGEAIGVSRREWHALTEHVLTEVSDQNSVILYVNLCKSRGLDPMKKPFAVVSTWDAKQGRSVDRFWGTLLEQRITAARTGLWAGTEPCMFGPDDSCIFEGSDNKGNVYKKDVTFPLWARVTVRKMVKGELVDFFGPTVWWREMFSAIGKTGVPNDMWARKPYYMLEKCAEAAALRRAFPEECSDAIVEEAGSFEVVQSDGGEITQAPALSLVNTLNFKAERLPPPESQEPKDKEQEVKEPDGEPAF